jgi:DNA-binding protein H-NS
MSNRTVQVRGKEKAFSREVLADPLGAFEVGEGEVVEQFGAGSRTEGVQALPEAAVEFVRTHRAGWTWSGQGRGRRKLWCPTWRRHPSFPV